MNRKPVIRHLHDFDGRTIVISDLHGNDTLFTRLLEKCSYKPGEDRLILLGDLVEKGTQNLDILHHIMELSKYPEVYAIMGNCDFVAKNVLYSYRLDYLRKVLTNRKESLIHEMAAKLNLGPFEDVQDMNSWAATIRKGFLEELSFLNDLPHVLITPTYIFAHSGIENEETIADDFRYVMTRYHFEEEDHHFSHIVVVGHMPVSEYCHRRADFSVRLEYQKNIISIDGGNAVKIAGQLNALIISRNYMETVSDDLLDRVKAVRTTRPKNFAPYYVTWADSELQILEKREKQSLVYSPGAHRRFWIDNEFLVDGKGSNFTNYEMPLNAGETVHLVNVWGHKAQIKKNSILGWTDISNLELSEEQKARPLDLS
ncbi:metallophosphoesterase [Allobaculum fili]|uniref:metallophosphoesterase n=2 Tax=Allobaculum TaxID=174708 RepID=UPI001E65D7BE|nr:metallophosphoesterase [Allobaculum fili]